MGFASDTCDEVNRHGGDSQGGEDIAERGDEFGFDDFNSDVIHKTFQGNLDKDTKGVSKDDNSGGIKLGKDGQPCSKPPCNPKLRNKQSGSCPVLCVAQEQSRAGGGLWFG